MLRLSVIYYMRSYPTTSRTEFLLRIQLNIVKKLNYGLYECTPYTNCTGVAWG